MLTLEQRIEAALLQAIAVCKNFNRKNDDEIVEILRNWGVKPDGPTDESVKPLQGTLNGFIESWDHVKQLACYGRKINEELNYYHIDKRTYPPCDPHAIAILGIDTTTPLYAFYQVISRKEKFKVGPYCWDTGQVLSAGDKQQNIDPTWLLIGPSFGLRQGKLTNTRYEARVHAILNGV